MGCWKQCGRVRLCLHEEFSLVAAAQMNRSTAFLSRNDNKTISVTVSC